MKSAYYTAVVTNAYRMGIDRYLADKEGYRFDPALLRELESVSHREYCTGYYFDKSTEEANLCTENGYIREKAYFATAIEADGMTAPDVAAENENGRLYAFIQRNKVSVGDGAELISPSKIGRPFAVAELYSDAGEKIESAPHPGQKFFVRVPFEVEVGDIMRAGEDK